MNNFNTQEKIEKCLKEANCYGKYNYCFTAQREDKLTDLALSMFGAVGVLINTKIKGKEPIGYIINKNAQGIGIIPIIKKLKEEIVKTDELIFLKDDEIEKVIIKKIVSVLKT